MQKMRHAMDPRHLSPLGWLVLALVALEALATAADLLLGPHARLATEEAHNARAGLQLACGHFDALWDLQYRPLCGGCSAEALAAVPLFRLLGPTLLAWKAVPAALHMLVVACGAGLAWRARGARAAALFCALMLAAPAAYRELTLTAWGNHAESSAFTLAAALLLALGLGMRRWWGGAPLALLAGGLAGLGLWFCYTSAYALPALGLLALLGWRRGGPSFFAGLPLGAVPWWLYHRARPEELEQAQHWWGALQLAPPAALWRWFAGDFIHGQLWPTSLGGLSPCWAFVFGGLGLLGAVLLWRREKGDAVAARFAPLALAGLLAAYLLRYDLWDDNPAVRTYDPFNLRYRGPMLPLLALGVAAALAWLSAGWRSWRARLRSGGALLLLAGLVGLGCWQRVTSWQAWRGAALGLSVCAGDLQPDRSVPSGQPPQRLARKQGRPADIEAALAFLEGHEDRFAPCRYQHLFELGRRMGLGSVARPGEPGSWLLRARDQLHDDEARRALAEGMAHSMGLEPMESWEPLLRPLEELPELRSAALRALGRGLAPGNDDHLPRGEMLLGLCEARGAAWLEERVGSGRLPIPLAEEHEHEICVWLPAWWQGLGRAWARHVGCGPEALRTFESVGLSREEGAREGLAAGCWAYRGRSLE